MTTVMESINFQYKSLTPQDLPDLENFFSRVYKEAVQYGSQSSFRWKIFENVHSLGIINAALHENNLVSTTTITPKSLYLKGSLIKSAEIGDTYTDENFQRRGLFANLVNRSRADAQAKTIEFIYGTPNRNSLPGYLKKCDFTEVDSLSVFSFSLPLNLNFLARRGIPQFFIGFLNFFYCFALKNFLSFKSAGIQVTEISRFEKRHDDLWKKNISSYDFIFSRPSSVLNWRFCDNPYSYRIFDIYHKDLFCGYVVIRTAEDTKTVFIADFLTDPNELPSFQRGLSHVASLFIGSYQNLNTWISTKDYALPAFTKNLFLRRNSVPIIFYNNLSSRLENLKSCHFSLADSDNI